MATRSSKKLDANQLAKSIVDQATGDAPKVRQPDTAQTAASRKGGQKGGRTRMNSLPAADRTALAKKGAAARWRKGAPAE